MVARGVTGNKLSILLTALILASSVNCQVQEVLVRFGDDNAGNITTVINTFDTIRWEFVNGDHQIVTPNLPRTDTNFFDSLDSQEERQAMVGSPGTFFEQTFRTGATEIFYECEIHPNIHFGTIIIQDRDGGAATITSMHSLCTVALALTVSLLAST